MHDYHQYDAMRFMQSPWNMYKMQLYTPLKLSNICMAYISGNYALITFLTPILSINDQLWIFKHIGTVELLKNRRGNIMENLAIVDTLRMTNFVLLNCWTRTIVENPAIVENIPLLRGSTVHELDALFLSPCSSERNLVKYKFSANFTQSKNQVRNWKTLSLLQNESLSILFWTF